MPIEGSDIADLVKGTLQELGRLRFEQIAQRLTHYEVFSRLMKKDKMQFDDGYGIKRSVMTDHSDAAEHVGLYNTDTVNVADVLQTIEVPWRHTTTNYAFDKRELMMNRGASRIVDLLKVRRTDGMLSLIELMETAFWGKPTDSNDKITPYGLTYWIVKNATTGFNGGAASGFTDGPGGLSPTTYTRWKNYTYQYTNITKDDLISGMRTGHRKIGFKSPVDVNDFRKGRGDMYRCYCCETVIKGIEDLGEAQNENLGRDIASMDGVMTFRRNPIIWAEKLDDDTQNPLYMLDMSSFYPVFMRGDYLRETGPQQAANQHNVMVVHVDLTWNILCVDRRRQAVFNTA